MVQLRVGTVVGVFKDQEHAMKAMNELRAAGFADSEVGLVTRDWVLGTPDRRGIEVQQKAGDGATAGAATGAGVGAVAGLIGASLIPGFGFVVAGGLLMGAVAGAALGAAAGTFAGPFVALGMSEDEVRRHSQYVEEGRTVVLVHSEERQAEAQQILLKHGAYDDSQHVGLN